MAHWMALPRVSRMRFDADPAAARLQALLPPVSRAPRVPPASLRKLRPLARIVASASGRLTGTEPLAIFTTLGRHPRLFRSWLFYSTRLMPFGTLPRRDAELLILRVAWQCGAAYEWWHHVPLALRAGLRPEEIAAAAGAPPTAGLSERRRVLIAITDDVRSGRTEKLLTRWAARETKACRREPSHT